MQVTQSAAQPAWWSQSFQSGERDVKQDIRDRSSVSAETETGDQGWGEDGFGFDDFIDIVNPLQHLPFISTLYRELTGDSIAPAARMAGGTLYGGPAGMIASVANVFVEAEAGADIGGTMVAQLTERDAAPSSIPAADDSGSKQMLAQAPNDSVPQQPISTDLANLPSPQALAAYAQASALGVPGRSNGPVDWSSGVITPKQESGPSLQSVTGRGLDDLIRESQAKTATRKRGPSLPSLTEPGLKNRGAAPVETASANPANPPANRAGLADWMMKALDKYETMKAPDQHTG
ncbi:MAG: hypothetical protein JJ959_14145 [Nisaea sp.]|uniref:hypothetical protein n=1 Tax=Nisaea sp. TaxID=2024842 RepID=UPI001B2B8657|nr:hypothetical protein [Nisaea sp.]MBO6561679.1 hypothetical protein [Nisaea sp.]